MRYDRSKSNLKISSKFEFHVENMKTMMRSILAKSKLVVILFQTKL